MTCILIILVLLYHERLHNHEPKFPDLIKFSFDKNMQELMYLLMEQVWHPLGVQGQGAFSERLAVLVEEKRRLC